MKIASFVSHGLVAVVAAGVSAFGMHWVSSAAAQAAANATTQVLVQPLPDLPGREVRISVLDREPLNAGAPHRHPGHHTFGYVVEGTYEIGVNGGPTRILKAGDTFYEPPTAVHSVSRNPSSDKPLKIVVFMVADQKNPSTVNEAAR
jgi:quercetin dioxygenase-like cupin family protein